MTLWRSNRPNSISTPGSSTTSRARPRKLAGIVYDQPDGDAAIKQAIVEYDVPPNERDRLIALLRD